jgi:hypothetical protein
MGWKNHWKKKKRQGREADHSLPSSAEIKDVGAIPQFRPSSLYNA